MASFKEQMKAALADKEEAEMELAEAVASSALGGGAGRGEELDAARLASKKAEERVSRLIEEAALYAEQQQHMAIAFESLDKEKAAERSRADRAETEVARLTTAAEVAAKEAADAVASAKREAAAADRKAEVAAKECRLARQAAVEADARATKTAAEARDRIAAVEAMCANAQAAADSAEKESKKVASAAAAETLRATQLVDEANSVVLSTKKQTEAELGEANKNSELHRQRRLATRSELLSVVKALEGARGVELLTERECRDRLAPALAGHAETLARLVQHALRVAQRAGLAATPPLAPRAAKGDGDVASKTDAPPAYIGALRAEIERVDAGLELLQQALDVLEDAVEPRGLCAFFLALLRPTPPKAVKDAAGARKVKGGYLRVDADVQEL
ncbi:hypothetical protein M885DRAFT_525768 [Pelagophyceae sp. CCMP2097]|nr:hypothetical protein M885DRAFT_525768 [Pelagophyceae sp. CCMP2097]|mmetsp:Transcript_9916/g.34928  ORF Transcript_9916/g.34928 Transcript_9916/m.34928 type:complete len:392 (+) Transcript_9916:80-1255(+)